MSLTSRLDDSQSPVRKFFSEQFPNTRPVTRECGRALSDVETIQPTTPFPYTTMGTALDYRLRYYFSVTPYDDLAAWQGATLVTDSALGQWEDADQYDWYGPEPGIYQESEGGSIVVLRNWQGHTQQYIGQDLRNALASPAGEYTLPAEVIKQFFSSLDVVVAQLDPAGARLERRHEEELARYCVVLALFEEVFQAGVNPGSLLFRGEPKTTVLELLSIAENHWVYDLCSLSWLFYERFGEVLTHPTKLSPTFDGSLDVGGANADLILDGCLIEMKSTINPRVPNLWLYQLLGYVFLDYSDRYQIHDVGLYLARQGVMFQWPLSELLNRLAGGVAPPLEELRGQFQHVVKVSK